MSSGGCSVRKLESMRLSLLVLNSELLALCTHLPAVPPVRAAPCGGVLLWSKAAVVRDPVAEPLARFWRAMAAAQMWLPRLLVRGAASMIWLAGESELRERRTLARLPATDCSKSFLSRLSERTNPALGGAP